MAQRSSRIPLPLAWTRWANRRRVHRWRVAVFVDGSFWHGHPSKWQPDRWVGYWDAKIKRNIARDERHNVAADAGWRIVRLWDFDVEHDPDAVAETVRRALEAAGRDSNK